MAANSRALTASQKAQIADLFHAGLTKRQTSACMGLAYDTVKTQWQAQGLIKGPPEPSEDVRIRAASRTVLLSSTMPTLIIIVFRVTARKNELSFPFWLR